MNNNDFESKQEPMRQAENTKANYEAVREGIVGALVQLREIASETKAFINESKERVIPAFEWLHETVSAYKTLFDYYAENIAPVIEQVVKLSVQLSVMHKLGKVEYVVWEAFPEEFFDGLSVNLSSEQLLKHVLAWHEETDFAKVDETIRLIGESPLLVGNPLLIQSIQAYKQGMYDIAALGFTAITDGLLTTCTGDITTNIKRRVEIMKQRLELSDDSALDAYELGNYALVVTYSDALEAFGGFASFAQDEPDLNRHWIAHGRMNRPMCQMDCIRIIGFLFGTILMSQLGEFSDEKTACEQVGED